MEVLQVGLVGLGMAGRAFVQALGVHPGARFAALAEPTVDLREEAARDYGVPTFSTLVAMLGSADLHAVCVATPTALHAEHVIAALDAGKHVIVEKPMAITLDQARAMVAAAERARRILLIGHSHSFDEPIRQMRAIIAGGSLGRVRMMNTWNFTDWVYRPRRPDELLTDAGGGVTYRQGAHQIDILRLLGGGLVEKVYARTFDWDPGRHVLGAHMVMLDFAGGASATAIYNGYGGMMIPELCGGVDEWGFPARPGQRPPSAVVDDVAEAKRRRAKSAERANAPFQPHFGLTVVSCERGDIRQSPTGLIVHGRDGRQEISLDAGRSPYELVVEEFVDAVAGRRAALHDGRWGLANLEVCVAAIRSAELGDAVRLSHQVAVEA